MKRIIPIYILFFLATLPQGNAQQKQQDTTTQNSFAWEFKVNAGYNIGGTIPIPYPAEIRTIETYSPLAWSPHLAVEAIYWFKKNWGVAAQLAIDRKGFDVTDSVYQLSTEMKDEGAVYKGNYTGINSNSIDNLYFTFPIMLSYKPTKKWIVQGGLYVAYLLSPQFISTAEKGYFRKGGPTGERVNISNSSMDFSQDQNTFDWGVMAAGEWIFYKKLSLRAQLAYGFNTIFPFDFTPIAYKMHNIYGTIGIAYSFGNLK